jgi:hypothetical protein
LCGAYYRTDPASSSGFADNNSSSSSSASAGVLSESARGTRSRLRACAELMEYSLVQIGEQLQRGAFRDLTADELGGIITAIFQESAGRAAVLGAIARM